MSFLSLPYASTVYSTVEFSYENSIGSRSGHVTATRDFSTEPLSAFLLNANGKVHFKISAFGENAFEKSALLKSAL